MTKEEKRQPVQSTRCMETVDIEELIEWMLLNPVSHPDNNFLYDITRADEPVVTPRFNGMNTEQVFNVLKQEEETND